VTDERHDQLSTADLADQRERKAERADDRLQDAGVDTRVDTREGHGLSRDDLAPGEDAVAEHEQASGGGGEPQAPAPLDRAGTGTTIGTAGTAGAAGAASGPLLPRQDAERFRVRWTDVQIGFVDAPRQAVEQADELVAELMQHLAKTFADARSGLEGQWDRGDDVPTDDLRGAFQRYRSFFERLLAT
jgi:hypothetical protein